MRSNLKTFWVKHPWLLKLVAVILLVLGFIWVPLVILWEERYQFRDCYREMWSLLR